MTTFQLGYYLTAVKHESWVYLAGIQAKLSLTTDTKEAKILATYKEAFAYLEAAQARWPNLFFTIETIQLTQEVY